MTKRLLLLLPALAGCTTVADVRAQEPFISTQTDASVNALSQCIGEQWQDRQGTVNSVPRDGGFTMTLTYTIWSSSVPAVVVDVDDLGERREVLVRAFGTNANGRLREEINACV